jgi:signal peptide peptidase SppA
MSSQLDVLTNIVARLGGLPDLITEAGLERYLAARLTPGDANRVERAMGVDRQGVIAVVDVRGVLSPRVEGWDEINTYRLADQLDALCEDDSVEAVLMHIESPGGYSMGMVELDHAAMQLAAKKPLIAQTHLCCCSGAYWLAARAHKIYAGPRDDVGSIGVRGGCMDWSGCLKNLGIEMVSITTGPLKDTGVFGTPMTDAKRAFLQERADAVMVDFVAAVQQGRKLSNEQMAAVTTGGWWTADKAHALGLVDGIQSFRATLAGLAAGSKPKVRSSKTMSETSDAPKAATHKELKAALPEASAEFILGQLEADATILSATQAFNTHLAAQLKSEKDAREKAETDAKAAADKANAAGGKGAGAKPAVQGLGDGTAQGSTAATAGAPDYYEEAKAYQDKHNVRWSEACRQVKRRVAASQGSEAAFKIRFERPASEAAPQ